MRKKCLRNDCPAPKGMCVEHGNPEYPKCDNWHGVETEELVEKSPKKSKKVQSLPWTGEPFLPTDIEIISQRSTPLIIGMIGSADAGKTSFLGMLYTLLFNGKRFEKWSFSGSYTLAGWESLAQYLKIKHDGKVVFAPPTSSHPDFYSLLHIALKKDNLFRDILFADSSGEVFRDWSEDILDPNVKNARWIYSKSSAFIFMVDCESLIENKAAAKNEIVQMAEQIAANLNDRPIAIVWSKADKIDSIRKNIKSALEEDLSQIFKDPKVFEVSNFPKSDLDPLCHQNNLAVTEYLLNEMNNSKSFKLRPDMDYSDDLLINYKGMSDSE